MTKWWFLKSTGELLSTLYSGLRVEISVSMLSKKNSSWHKIHLDFKFISWRSSASHILRGIGMSFTYQQILHKLCSLTRVTERERPFRWYIQKQWRYTMV